MRNPPWTRDEHILALDFYFRHVPKIPGKHSTEVKDLSDLLNRLQQETTQSRSETFRNPAGIYMKLMNFRSIDPDYSGIGLANNSKDEQVVWDLYSTKRVELKNVAEEIKRLIDSGTQMSQLPVLDAEETEAEEGRVLSRLHRYRERDRAIIVKKKAQFLREHGSLHCEACGFDFARVYGERGRNFIECHHTKPVSQLSNGEKTLLSDLVLLCSNCHRIVHTQKPWISFTELIALLTASNPD